MTNPSARIIEEWSLHLRQCGWTLAETPAADVSGPAGGESGAECLRHGAAVWTAGGDAGPRLTLARLDGQWLPAAQQLFARYLDCPREARRLVWAAPAPWRADYWLVCDDRREYWLDVARDACVGGEAAEGKAREAIWPRLPLDQARAGRLEEALDRPAQVLGRELAAWVALWINELGSASGRSPLALRRFFFQLALALKALRAGAPGPGGAPSALRALAGGLLAAPNGAPNGAADTGLAGELAAALPAAFAELEKQFPGRLLAGAGAELGWLKELAGGQPGLVSRLAAELPMISASKVATDALVEALGDPDIEPVAWRQAVTTTPEELERELVVEGRHVVAPLTIDTGKEGLGWLLRCARWAIRYWTQRIENEREDRARPGKAVAGGQPGGGLSWQLDMTLPWPLGVNEDGVVENCVQYALGNSLRVRARKPVHRLAAELLLFALAVEETSEEPQALPAALNLQSIWV